MSFDELVRRARACLGEEGAVALALAEVAFLVAQADASRRGEYELALGALRSSLGEAFATELEAQLVLRARRGDERAVQRRLEQLTEERFVPPVVSSAELSQFFESGEAARVVDDLGPAFKRHLEDALRSLGVSLDELPEEDLARQLSKAAGLGARRSGTKQSGRRKR